MHFFGRNFHSPEGGGARAGPRLTGVDGRSVKKFPAIEKVKIFFGGAHEKGKSDIFSCRTMKAHLHSSDTMTILSSTATWLLGIKLRTQHQHHRPSTMVTATPSQLTADQPEYLSFAFAGIEDQFDAIMARLDRIESKVDQFANNME